jgi:excisionase family DNA binding protein
MTGYQGDPNLLTIPTAAELLGISALTGYRLARAGQFPGDAAIKVGRSWRVSLPKLRRYLGSDREHPVAAAIAGTAESAAKVRRLLEALVVALEDPVIIDRIIGKVGP